MKKQFDDFLSAACLKAVFFSERNAGALLAVLGGALLCFGNLDLALAQTGGEIFQGATTTLACKVMPGSFGAMISAFAGLFALIAAATGAYRGAWALVFVSIGAFIFKEFIKILFPDSVGC